MAEKQGTPVYVGDVAEVEFGRAIRRGTLISNGQESVGGFVLKLIDTNTQEVLDRIEQKVEQIQGALPDGVKLVEYYSQGDLVEKAVSTVEDALLEGAVLVLIFLYFFLGNVRSTLVVISVLPLSALVSFIGMRYMGLSANLMSLGGLAIGIGMMVDGAVVVVENIYRFLEEREDEDVSMVRLVGEATREVGRPVVFAISIIIIVFLPLFTLQGVEGKMFSPMAYAISFALVGALLLALTFIPVASSFLFRKDADHEEPKLVRWLKKQYRPVVSWAYERPKRVLGAAVAALAVSLALFPFLGTEFVPTLREGTFMVRSVLPAGASLDKSVEYSKQIQKSFRQFSQVEGVYSRVGRAEVGGDPEPVNVVASLVTLKPLGEWEGDRDYEELQSAMADSLSHEVPGLASNFSQPI
ncbi:MAG: efflux RND transporter permease subunit, partial [Gemmatimonadota bacterium]